MPFKYSIDLQQNLIRQTLWGKVTAGELRDLALAMWQDPIYRKKLDILGDLREAQVDIPYDQMVSYTRFLIGNSDIGRQALVVGRQLEFGMARMYEQLTEDGVGRIDMKVFFDMDEAEQWIGCKEAVATGPEAGKAEGQKDG